jgi:hypothetical protein
MAYRYAQYHPWCLANGGGLKMGLVPKNFAIMNVIKASPNLLWQFGRRFLYISHGPIVLVVFNAYFVIIDFFLISCKRAPFVFASYPILELIGTPSIDNLC